MWAMYTMEYYSTTKKDEGLPFVTMWIGLASVILSKIGHIEKEKYDFTYMWSLKSKT